MKNRDGELPKYRDPTPRKNDAEQCILARPKTKSLTDTEMTEKSGNHRGSVTAL